MTVGSNTLKAMAATSTAVITELKIASALPGAAKSVEALSAQTTAGLKLKHAATPANIYTTQAQVDKAKALPSPQTALEQVTGANATIAAEKQTLANFAGNNANRFYRNLDMTINERGLLAQERNLAETAGWKHADGNTWWPPYDGAIPGSLRVVTLEPGSGGAISLVDRFGRTSGSYVSPAGVPFESRALSSIPTFPASVYSIDANIIGVEKATVAPWFSQKGLGIQYKLPNSVQYYLDNLMLGEPK